MIKFTVRFLILLFVIFIIPALVHLGLWSMRDQPSGWRQADWSSAGVLPQPAKIDDAKIYLLAARTGGIKGAFATHSWLVLKKPGNQQYDRYEVVGWGQPVRKNAYDPDGRWYSNKPEIIAVFEGKQAADSILKIETAIANYKWQRRGDYTLWPGPNSNTFIQTVLQSAPDLQANTPSTAIGRDFPADGRWAGMRKDGTVFASAKGYAGLALGKKRGLEINFLGLVAGVSPMTREIKIPAFGSYRW